MLFESSKECVGWSVSVDGSIIKTLLCAEPGFPINDRHAALLAKERDFFVKRLPVGYVIPRKAASHR
jgi:hypothetical protein